MAKIEVHHLNNSRSQRILWLLEELGLDYQIIAYQRDPLTRLAPASLKAIHPLGKSPVIRDSALVLAESGRSSNTWSGATAGSALTRRGFCLGGVAAYLHWLHFAEGSAMLPLLLKLYVGLLKGAGQPLLPRIESELKAKFDYLSTALGEDDYFVANTFSAADIQLSFVLDAGAARGPLKDYPNLVRLDQRLKARAAYQRALQRGGPYELAR
jgi:glutathione S-transferase